jgi:hypothetical protein
VFFSREKNETVTVTREQNDVKGTSGEKPAAVKDVKGNKGKSTDSPDVGVSEGDPQNRAI